MEWPYEIYGYLHDTNLPHITIMIGSSMKQRERKVLFVSSQMTTDRWTTLVQMKRKSVLSPLCQRNDGLALDCENVAENFNRWSL